MCADLSMENEKSLIDDTLIEDGRTVVLGLSGGPDSVCLLYELLALGSARRRAGGTGNPIVCAHVNHGLRGAESDGDEDFVEALCGGLGAPVEFARIDAARDARQDGKTVEEAGRDARYAFFDEVCAKYEERLLAERGAHVSPVIAVAHNRDDQAETVLMRILRGTGVDGLAGMAKRRRSAAGYDIVRPLLGVSRAEIERRLAELGAAFRTDDSNLKTEYFRNRIRLEVFPYIEQVLGSGLRQGLARLAENANEDREYFETAVERYIGRHLVRSGEHSAELPAASLAELAPALRHRLIRAVFAGLGLRRDIAAVHLAAADRLLATFADGGEASGKRVEFPADYTFGIARKNAVFRAPDAAEPAWKPRRRLKRQNTVKKDK